MTPAKNWLGVIRAPYGGGMARALSQTKSGGTAGRIAARRVDRGSGRSAERAAPKKARVQKSSGGRGKKSARGEAPAVLKAMKLVLLLAFMAVLGFAVVLVVDVGLTLMGGLHLGNVTFSELVEKVEDRVFDRDLPEPRSSQKAKAPPTTSKPAPKAKAKPKARPANS